MTGLADGKSIRTLRFPRQRARVQDVHSVCFYRCPKPTPTVTFTSPHLLGSSGAGFWLIPARSARLSKWLSIYSMFGIDRFSGPSV
jgi:hypothetical protein